MARRTTFCGTTTRTIVTSTTQAATNYHQKATMLVKTRIPHETTLRSVIQVPYSSTFVKITTVHVRIIFTSRVFFKIQRSKTWVRIRFSGTLESHKYSIYCCTFCKNGSVILGMTLKHLLHLWANFLNFTVFCVLNHQAVVTVCFLLDVFLWVTELPAFGMDASCNIRMVFFETKL